MCVTYFAWLHPQLPDILLLLLFNRDEVLDRWARTGSAQLDLVEQRKVPLHSRQG